MYRIEQTSSAVVPTIDLRPEGLHRDKMKITNSQLVSASGMMEEVGKLSRVPVDEVIYTQGALAHCEAHISVSTTGIAGPTGAVPGKPVGTVCFAWVVGGVTHTERLVFSGDRRAVREQSVVHALDRLLRYVAEI